MRDQVRDEYFEWLFNIVCGDRFSEKTSYRKLLVRLHSTEFIYSVPKDRNRAEDGLSLRRRFILLNGYENSYGLIMEYLHGPCSVFEMMAALAICCEESIMDDPNMGDRTGQWFWGMIANLGLNDMWGAQYDQENVDSIIKRFLNRDYEPNGKGGLFTVRHCDADLRDVEIWYQLCWYLDTIT